MIPVTAVYITLVTLINVVAIIVLDNPHERTRTLDEE
jgi:hypothetical protein